MPGKMKEKYSSSTWRVLPTAVAKAYQAVAVAMCGRPLQDLVWGSSRL
jgi:hypothetical protein